jgi:RimJ/RimL family protein N-acetyltransferase
MARPAGLPLAGRTARGRITGVEPIRTVRLVLRPFEAGDLEQFVSYRSDPEVARYQSWEPPYSHAEAEAFLADRDRSVFGAPDRWFQVAIADRGSGSLVGDVGIHVVASQPETCELGVTLARASQGRGIATEALEAIVALLFERDGMHRLFAQVDDRNLGAQRLFDRLGFRCEARSIEADWFKGEWTTLRTYALLQREFLGRVAALSSWRTDSSGQGRSPRPES